MLSNWFGSDVYEAYTSAYTWQSNQMAHAMMGFAGTVLLASAAAVLQLELLYGAAFIALPIMKDVTDVVIDLGRARGGAGVKAPFSARLSELIRDAATDALFWTIGAVVALAVLCWAQMPHPHPLAPWVTLIGLVMLLYGLLVSAPFYLRQKRAFDRTALPYFYRLPTFDGTFADANGPKAVTDFIENATAVTHLVLHGAPGARKTTLAAGIGSGLTVRRTENGKTIDVRYIPAAKLVDEIARPDGETAGTGPVSVRDADILIVDDIDPDLTANQLNAICNACAVAADTLTKILGKPAVWVVAQDEKACSWSDWLSSKKPDIEVVPIGLSSSSAEFKTPQFSILRGQWRGIFPLVMMASAISAAVAAVWIVGRVSALPPAAGWLVFFGVLGIGIALVIDAIGLRRPLRKSP